MASSRAATVDEYLAELPEARREVVQRVLEVVRAKLPAGYEEAMAFGMIGWGIPLERYPKTYNKQPLSYAALAAQKNHYALYLMGAYADPAQQERLEAAFREAGKTMDMGAACLRFRSIDDLPLEAVGAAIASTPPERFIELYETSRRG